MADLEAVLAERFRRAIAAAFGAEHADVDPLVRPTQDPRFGDYQANVAMGLAGEVGRAPREVAAAIVEHLEVDDLAEDPEVAGPGFINLTLTGEFLARQAADLLADRRLGVPTPEPEVVVIDYSHPNVAREMHVGHLRSTVIGDALARTLEFLGHRVIRQNHLGDWGTQFGMLIEHLVELGWDGEPRAVGDLSELYRRANERFRTDEEFAERARKRVVALQGGDRRTLRIWRALVAESQRHFNEIYRRLDITLSDEDVRGESFYNPMLPEVVEELEAKGLTTLSEGAVCVFPPGFTRPDGEPLAMIVQKSDGGYLYATTDLAALRFRARELGADRVIYVVDARQSQHLVMVFAVAEMAGWTRGVRVEHAPFGTVLGEDGRPFRTRAGGTVRLAALIDEAVERARRVVEEKDPDLAPEERDQVAHTVAVGALKYADLSGDRVKDYVFSWDRMLALEGNTAPYLQYAYTRIRSIFRKGGIDHPPLPAGLRIDHPAERALVLHLFRFPPTVRSVEETLQPHRLCTHLYELATAFSGFYESCPVLRAEEPARSSRLALCHLTARTLEQGLGLLGIRVLERM